MRADDLSSYTRLTRRTRAVLLAAHAHTDQSARNRTDGPVDPAAWWLQDELTGDLWISRLGFYELLDDMVANGLLTVTDPGSSPGHRRYAPVLSRPQLTALRVANDIMAEPDPAATLAALLAILPLPDPEDPS